MKSFSPTQWHAVLFVLFIFLVTGCTDNTDGSGQPAHMLTLSLFQGQVFNPQVEHGKIEKFRVTLSSNDLPTAIVRLFDRETTTAEFKNLKTGSTVQVMVEAINSNGVVVRRGRSGDVIIAGGGNTVAEVVINNVPIFANVRDGAIVDLDRFIPKIFAPGGLEFEITDWSNGQTSYLKDVITDALSFSIGVDDPHSIRAVYAQLADTGNHQLTVRDILTGESTTINVDAERRAGRNPQVTTAGADIGSVISAKGDSVSTLIDYHRLINDYYKE